MNLKNIFESIYNNDYELRQFNKSKFTEYGIFYSNRLQIVFSIHEKCIFSVIPVDTAVLASAYELNNLAKFISAVEARKWHF